MIYNIVINKKWTFYPWVWVRLIVEKEQKERGFLCNYYTVEPIPAGSGDIMIMSGRFGEESFI